MKVILIHHKFYLNNIYIYIYIIFFFLKLVSLKLVKVKKEAAN